ncbi:tyrosine-type recombinase/integrase [Dictyobacter arantiisoli]|uniref:Tyrosine recombinase XerC n=1 Tax=Dictyobacter arantiisoli TaxID=2014874 RepID=A0A5A5T6J0_9CHLR|nr:tyrosine-type recombinase/integrase [Dictyobacter arantiisoli]GCF07080.1 tyrosine recombinase XerC [Dictyobacter arantiisoli]
MLQEVVDDFVASLASEGVERAGGSHNTRMAYRNDLGQLCTYMLKQGITTWSEVTPDHLLTYISSMREGQVYRPATIARKLAAFRTFFRYLGYEERIKEDPTVDILLPPIVRGVPHVLNTTQINVLFRLAEQDTPFGLRDFAMLHLLYATGIRTSELVALDLNQYQREHGFIHCSGVRGRSEQDRCLPLTPAAVDAMENYLLHGREWFLRSFGEPALFLNHRGERLSRQGFWLIIKGYARRAGIHDLTPHRLRHSFTLLMLNNGMEVESIQELLGHVHLSTTQIYCQLIQA